MAGGAQRATAGAGRLAIKAVFAAGLLTLGLYLAWECLALAVTRDTAIRRPDATLTVNENDAFGLGWVAEAQMISAKAPADFRRAVDLARRSLRFGPLEAAPLRVIAFDAERRGDRAQADALMAIAGERTRRDTQTQNWLFGAALRRGDYAAAFEHGDAMLRRSPDTSRFVFPTILAALEDPKSLDPLARRLATKPGWRNGLLAEVSGKVRDVAVARSLLDRLKFIEGGLSDDEVRPLVSRLIAAKDYRLARETWAAFLPKGQSADGILYDASLKSSPGTAPFNWRLTDNVDAIAEFAEDPEGVASLHVQDRGALALVLAEQLVVLSPGGYRLAGRMNFASEGPPEHPAWLVQCVAGDTPIAQMRQVGREPGWRSFSLDFTVPSHGCEAQWLRLRGTTRDSFEPSEAWFADLTLVPLG